MCRALVGSDHVVMLSQLNTLSRYAPTPRFGLRRKRISLGAEVIGL